MDEVALVLHNMLSTKSRDSYTPPDAFDEEIGGNTVTPGFQREDGGSKVLLNLPRIRQGNHYSRNTEHLRRQLAEYFYGTGQVIAKRCTGDEIGTNDATAASTAVSGKIFARPRNKRNRLDHIPNPFSETRQILRGDSQIFFLCHLMTFGNMVSCINLLKGTHHLLQT